MEYIEVGLYVEFLKYSRTGPLIGSASFSQIKKKKEYKVEKN